MEEKKMINKKSRLNALSVVALINSAIKTPTGRRALSFLRKEINILFDGLIKESFGNANSNTLKLHSAKGDNPSRS